MPLTEKELDQTAFHLHKVVTRDPMRVHDFSNWVANVRSVIDESQQEEIDELRKRIEGLEVRHSVAGDILERMAYLHQRTTDVLDRVMALLEKEQS